MIREAVVLSAGNELTTGKVIDTNSSIIADRLFSIGIRVAAILKVGDDREMLLWALDQARNLGDLVIGIGGLGPGADDVTTEIIAKFLGCRIQQNRHFTEALKKRFESRRLAWTPSDLKQAQFPQGATIIDNPTGTVPGFRLSLGREKTLIWLPDIPQEMTLMLERDVLPWVVQQRGIDQQCLSCTFKIYGITESKLAEVVRSVDTGPHAKLSFRAAYPDLALRLIVSGPEKQRLLTSLRAEISARLGAHVYAQSDATLEEIVGQMLLDKNYSLALAESCTGGYISHRITRVAGSSAYYYGGAVTYSDDAKESFLGVAPETLQKYGAVSRQTALEMSRGIKEKTGASIGFSVTGIAGPGGGSPEKPVGTVWMSIAYDLCHEARVFQFHGDREHIILGASQAALYWLQTDLLLRND